jgi:5-methylcytosine-specific restriction endonuclease McrA
VGGVTYDELIAKAVGKALKLPAVVKEIKVPMAWRNSSGIDAKILKIVLRAKQASLCGICGCRVPSFDGNLDHVVPRKWGGRDLGNRVFTHQACNQKKGSRMPNGCERIWLQVANA